MTHSGNRNYKRSISDFKDDNSPELKTSSENMLRTQNKLERIDQVIHKMNLKDRHLENSSNQESSYSSRSATDARRIGEIRNKRSFNTNRKSEISPEHRKRKYESDDILGIPEKIYSDGKMKFKRQIDNNDFDSRLYSIRSIDKPINEELRVSKNLSRNRDDLKSSYKKCKDDTKDRWSRDYEAARKNQQDSSYSENDVNKNEKIDSEVKDLDDSSIRHKSSQIIGTVSTGKSRTIKEANVDEFPLSLERLKPAVLKLSKSFIEPNKGTNGNVNVTNISRPEEYERQLEEDTGRKEGHTKSEHERDISSRGSKYSNAAHEAYSGTEDKSSNWLDDPKSAAGIFDFKRMEDDLEEINDFEDENGSEENELEEETIPRVKREEKNKKNERNSDFLHPEGFRESSSKILNDRERDDKSLDKEENQAAIEFEETNQNPITKKTEENTSEYSDAISEFKNRTENVLNADESSNNSNIINLEAEDANKNIILSSSNDSNNFELNELDKLSKINNENNDKTVGNNSSSLSNSVGVTNMYQNDEYSGLYFLFGGKKSGTVRKLLWIPVKQKEIKLSKEKDSVPNKKKYNYSRSKLIVTNKGYMVEKNIKGTEDDSENNEMMKILHRRKGRRILQEDDIEKCQNNANDDNEEAYQDEELEKSSDMRNENSDDLGEDYRDQDMEDIIQNYNDKEEELEDHENEYEGKDRSKISDSNKDGTAKKRYVPLVQYFEYDENTNNRDEELPIMVKAQKKSKDAFVKKRGIPKKKNEQKMEDDKHDKEKQKTKNKIPTEEFIGNINIPDVSKNETSGETSNETSNVSLKTNNFPIRGEMNRDSRRSDMDSNLWSDQSSQTYKLLKALKKDNEDSERTIISEPFEYNLKVRGKLKAEDISDFSSNNLPLEENLFAQDKNLLSLRNNERNYEPRSNEEYYKLKDGDMNQERNLEPIYEELKNINDRRENMRGNSRLREEQKMYHDCEGVPDKKNNPFNSKSSRDNWYLNDPDREEDPKIRSFKNEGKNEISERQNYIRESQGKLSGLFNTDNKSSSGSNYLALKITDDLFKGGVEQSNLTEEKPSNEIDPSQRLTAKWKVVKPVKIEKREEISLQKNKDFKRDKRTILNSEDLMHESFVDFLDWMNDFDDDRKIRLGRGLKSLHDNVELRNVSIFEKMVTPIYLTTTKVSHDDQIKNVSILQEIKFNTKDTLTSDEKNYVDKFKDLIRNLTITNKRNITKSIETDSFFNYRNVSKIDQILRTRRETDSKKDHLNNTKDNHKVRNNFSDMGHNAKMRKKSVSNAARRNRSNKLNPSKNHSDHFYRTSLGDQKGRKGKNKRNHYFSLKDARRKNWHRTKRYSPEGNQFHRSDNRLRSRYKQLRDQENQPLNDIDLQKLYKKILLITSFVNEYNALTEEEKSNIHNVHGYLIRDLSNFVNIIESRKNKAVNYEHSSSNGMYKKLDSTAQISQVPNAQPDLHKKTYPTYKNKVSSFEKFPEIMKHGMRVVTNNRMKKRNIQSMRKKSHHSKHKNHKKRRRKHRKHKKLRHNFAGSTSREYRKIEYRNPKLRRKRANMDDADLNSYNSAYEEPGIHSPDIFEAGRYRYSLEKDGWDSNKGYTGNRENMEINAIKKYSKKTNKKVFKASTPCEDGFSDRISQDLKGNLRNVDDEHTIDKGNLTRPQIQKKLKLFNETVNGVSLPKNRECSGSIISEIQNNETDKKTNSSNSSGLVTLELKVFKILPLSFNSSHCKYDEKNLTVEDEVRRMEEKTNVYPDTTELMEKIADLANTTNYYLANNKKI